MLTVGGTLPATGAAMLAALRAGGAFPRLRANPGPMKVAGLHFSRVLEHALDRLDQGDRSVDTFVAHSTDEFVTLYDGYPKAAAHLLVVPKHRIAALRELTPEHLSMLHRLAAYVTWVIEALGSQELSFPGWTHGLHSAPSLRQLHVHILSLDFQSPCLKRADHFNSFQRPFLVPLDEAIEAVETGRDLVEHFNLDDAEARLKRQDLQCHRCAVNFGRRFDALKRHISSCSHPVPLVTTLVRPVSPSYVS